MRPTPPESAAVRGLSFIVPGPLSTPTGGYAYDRHMAEELRARGWRVDVHELDGGYPWPEPEALERACALLASLPEGALVLCDGLAFGTMPSLAARHGARLRLVALVHHPLAAETGLTDGQAAALLDSEHRALRHTRGVIVTSRVTAARLADYGVPPARVAVVEPGTAPAPPARGTRAVDARAPIAMLCVASLMPRKGHAVLIDALRRLRDRPWTLTCVGSATLDAATAERVRAAVRELGLDARVVFTGAMDGADLARAYDAADLLVMPTYYEGYGMAVAEAVARGLPVVGSPTGALPDLVDERSGVLVPPGDVDALTAALEGIIDDEARRSRLAAGARARAAALPSWPAAAMAMETALIEAGARGALQR